MAGTNYMERLELVYAAPITEENMWSIVEEVASSLMRSDTPPAFVLEQRSSLPAPPQGAEGATELWRASGAEVQLRRELLPGLRQETAAYRLHIGLQLRSGFSMEITGETDRPGREDAQVVLHHLRPEDFDLVRQCLNQELGEQADLSMEAPLASRNAEAAMEAGYGAFARHLIDQAMEAFPQPASSTRSKYQRWWDRLQELREAIPRQGPEPDTTA